MPTPWDRDARLPTRLNLEQLKKQAKELVKAYANGDPAAIAFAREHRPDGSTFQLSDAQFVLARYHGAPSWPALNRRLSGEGTPPTEAPLLPIRGIVVFPGGRLPLHIGREPSLRAVEHAIQTDGFIVCAAQREPKNEAPEPDDIHRVGTLCRLVAVKPLTENGHLKIGVEGIERVELTAVETRDGYRCAAFTPRPMPAADAEANQVWKEAVAAFEAYAEHHDAISHRAVVQVARAETARSALGLLLQHVQPLAVSLQQELLEARDPMAGLAAAARALNQRFSTSS